MIHVLLTVYYVQLQLPVIRAPTDSLGLHAGLVLITAKLAPLPLIAKFASHLIIIKMTKPASSSVMMDISLIYQI